MIVGRIAPICEANLHCREVAGGIATEGADLARGGRLHHVQGSPEVTLPEVAGGIATEGADFARGVAARSRLSREVALPGGCRRDCSGGRNPD